MIRLIVLSIVAVMVYKYLKKSFFNPASFMPNQDPPPPQTPELKKCTECEKFMNQPQMQEKEGHFFCSSECYTKFLDKRK